MAKGEFKLKTKKEDLFAKRDNSWIDQGDGKFDIARQQRPAQAGGLGGAGNTLFIVILIAVVGFVIFKLRSRK